MLAVNTDSKNPRSWLVFWSVVWAVAIIATAYFFKGNPAEYWIEAALIVGALTFVILRRRQPTSPR